MKALRFLIIAITAIWLGGCGVDRLTIIEHPNQVRPSTTFDVSLINLYLYFTMDSTGIIKQNVIRDSLHLMLGSVAGWNLQSATFYAAPHLNMVSLTATRDTLALIRMMTDSLAAFKSRAIPMTADNNAPVLMANRTLQAFSSASASDSITVNTSAVAQWRGLRAPVNIRLTIGSKADTVISYQTVKTGIKTIPVFIFAKVTARSVEAMDTLFYFSKTDTLPGTASDIGHMVFKPVKITNTIAAVSSRLSTTTPESFFARRHAGGIAVHVPRTMKGPVTASLYSADGRVLGKRTGYGEWVEFNGTVGKGMYFVTASTGDSHHTCAITLTR